MRNQLEATLRALIRKATRIEVQSASRPPESSRLASHFGGPPYFESGMAWPKNKAGAPLSFVLQLYNDDQIHLPPEIKLMQLFYDWKAAPMRSKADGWKVILYESLRPETMMTISKPGELGRDKYCELKFATFDMLPDWEGLEDYSMEAVDLCVAMNEDDPPGAYEEIVDKLIGQEVYCSHIGGYPQWVQSGGAPKLPVTRLPMHLVLRWIPRKRLV